MKEGKKTTTSKRLPLALLKRIFLEHRFSTCGLAMLREHMCRQTYSRIAPLHGEHAPLHTARGPEFTRGKPAAPNEWGVHKWFSASSQFAVWVSRIS